MSTIKFLYFILLMVMTTIWSSNWNKESNNNTINSILGDISFKETFGNHPTQEIDEDLRIKTHLAFVENLLRQQDVSHLATEQAENRQTLLNLLHEYRTAGVFPRNYDYPGKRVPCFIDKHGRICAVGYLIEQTAGREASEEINRSHQYEQLLAMNDPIVDRWIETSGLTKEECAMIQPQYGTPIENETYIHTNEAIASAGLSGLNMGFTLLNTIHLAKNDTRQTIPSLSLVSGLGQIAFGGYLMDEYSNNNVLGFGSEDFTTMKKIGMTNIAIGTTTALIGGYRLLSNRKKEDKSTAWNIYSFSTVDRQPGIGISLVKRW